MRQTPAVRSGDAGCDWAITQPRSAAGGRSHFAQANESPLQKSRQISRPKLEPVFEANRSCGRFRGNWSLLRDTAGFTKSDWQSLANPNPPDFLFVTKSASVGEGRWGASGGIFTDCLTLRTIVHNVLCVILVVGSPREGTATFRDWQEPHGFELQRLAEQIRFLFLPVFLFSGDIFAHSGWCRVMQKKVLRGQSK